MLMFWKARLVLLAVPKTGTTALEAALLPHADAAIVNPPGLKHCTLKRYRNQLQRFFEQRGSRKLEIMAVMREPESWLSSWYRYRARPELAGDANSTAGISFDDFISDWLTDTPAEFARVGRQSRFLAEEDGSMGADHLFRYDRLGEAVSFLEERLGTTLDLAPHNVSARQATNLSPVMQTRLLTEAPEEFDLWSRLCAARP